jgi:hypothetical protein
MINNGEKLLTPEEVSRRTGFRYSDACQLAKHGEGADI